MTEREEPHNNNERMNSLSRRLKETGKKEKRKKWSEQARIKTTITGKEFGD